MSLTVVFRETALRNLARLRGEDKDAFAEVRSAIASLAGDPRPAGAVGSFYSSPTAATSGSPAPTTAS